MLGVINMYHMRKPLISLPSIVTPNPSGSLWYFHNSSTCQSLNTRRGIFSAVRWFACLLFPSIPLPFWAKAIGRLPASLARCLRWNRCHFPSHPRSVNNLFLSSEGRKMKERCWLRLYFGHNAEMKGEITEVGSEIEGGRDTKAFTALILNAMKYTLPWSRPSFLPAGAGQRMASSLVLLLLLNPTNANKHFKAQDA